MIRFSFRVALFCLSIGIGALSCNNTPSASPGNPADNNRHDSAVAPPVPGDFQNLVSDYENQDRVIWQKPNMVIDLLGDLSDKTVVDLGAGTGYFAFRLLPKAKKVIAVDIDRRFINFMDSLKVRLPEELQARFESRLADPNDARLKAGEANAIIIVNTYAYIENRVAYMTNLRKGLVKGGKLLIIDFKKKNIPIGPPQEFKVADSQVESELLQAGFRNVAIDEQSLDYQYIITANN